VRKNFAFEAAVGNGDGGSGKPSFFARFRRIVFLYVSRAMRVRRMERIAKKMVVHCVHRQDLRTVTNEPITGLWSMISSNIK